MAGDFVNVKLTTFGESLGQVAVHEGHREFVARPGDVLHVTRALEWERILKLQQIDGKPLFEIVEDAPGAKPARAAKAEKTSEVKS
jgi:hypothetical protein